MRIFCVPKVLTITTAACGNTTSSIDVLIDYTYSNRPTPLHHCWLLCHLSNSFPFMCIIWCVNMQKPPHPKSVHNYHELIKAPSCLYVAWHLAVIYLCHLSNLFDISWCVNMSNSPHPHRPEQNPAVLQMIFPLSPRINRGAFVLLWIAVFTKSSVVLEMQ